MNAEMTSLSPDLRAFCLSKGIGIQKKVYSSTKHVMYLAEQNQQRIMLKISKDTITRSLEEYKFLKKLENTDVSAKPLEYFEEPGFHGMSFVPVDGIPLSSLLESPLSISKFLEIAVGIIDCLRVIHGHRIIHGDINPENILVSKSANGEGRYLVHIIDFEMAQEFGTWTNHTHALPYLSPEETRRLSEIPDYRADLWSCGVIFYQLLTSKVPFSSTSVVEFMHDIVSRQSIPSVRSERPDVPLAVSGIISRLLAVSPSERYQSTYSLWSDLKKCAEMNANGDTLDSGFKIGQDDFPIMYHISDTLIDRERETETLFDTFKYVKLTRHNSLVLVGGYTGSGKTALVHQLKSVERMGALFTWGKALPNTRCSDPYGVISHAFVPLIRALLSNDAIRKSCRERVEHCLGSLIHILTSVIPCVKELMDGSDYSSNSKNEIPEFPSLVSASSQTTDLAPKEAESRFIFVLVKFICALTAPGRPLVMVLDDFHWASSATVRIIAEVLLSESCENILIVGTYRTNETSPTHPLISLRERIRAEAHPSPLSPAPTPLALHHTMNIAEKKKDHRVILREIDLSGLTVESARELLHSSIRIEEESRSEGLLRLLQQRTNGNPFFFTQCLKMLYDRELLWWDWRTNKWVCDLAAVDAAIQMSNNTAELLIQRLSSLSDSLRETLAAAACIGSSFSEDLLAEVQNVLALDTLHTHLQAATESSLIVLVNNEGLYRFAHDLIHSAVYNSIPAERRAVFHLHIGRILEKKRKEPKQSTPVASATVARFSGINPHVTQTSDSLLPIVQHLNKAEKLLTEPADRTRLAQMNLAVGRESFGLIAYDSAQYFFEFGLQLLPVHSWQTQRSLAFRLSLEHLRALSLQDPSAATKERFSDLLSKALTLEEKTEVYLLLMAVLSLREEWSAGTERALELLSLLGAEFPELPLTDEDLQSQVQRVLELISNREPKSIPLTPINDRKHELIMRCLSALLPLTFWLQTKTFFYAASKIVELSLRYGFCQESSTGFVTLGNYLATTGTTELADKGCALAEAAVKMASHFQDLGFRGQTLSMYGVHICFLRQTVDESINNMKHALQLLIESSQVLFSALPSLCIPLYMLFGRHSLTETLNEIRVQAKHIHDLVRMKCINGCIRGVGYSVDVMCTAGYLPVDEFYSHRDILDFEKAMLEPPSPPTLFVYLTSKLVALVVLQQTRMAVEVGRQASALSNTSGCHLFIFAYYVFYCLALAQEYSQQRDISSEGGAKGEAIAGDIANCVTVLERLVSAAPQTKAYYLLAKAMQLAYVDHKPDQACQAFDDALVDVTSKRCGLLRAVILEHYGIFMMSQNAVFPAKMILSKSFSLYSEIGAAAKVAIMRRRFNFLEFDPIGNGNGVNNHNLSLSATSRTLQVDIEAAMKIAGALSEEINLDKLLKKIVHVILEDTGAERGFLILEDDNHELRALTRNSKPPSESEPECLLVPLQEVGIPVDAVSRVRRTRESLLVENACLDDRFSLDPTVHSRGIKSMICMPLLKRGVFFGILYLENNKFPGAFTDDRMHLLNVLTIQMCISIENAQMVHKLQCASAELQKKNEALNQADQMKDRFLALTSHELRTPLNGIMGTASILRETPLTGEQMDLVRTIEVSSHSLMLLVNDLLDLSKIQAGKLRFDKRPFNLLECIDDSVAVVSPNACAKGIELVLLNRCSTDLPVNIIGDSIRLQQILLNLLSNAIKFTEVGSVTLTLVAWKQLPASASSPLPFGAPAPPLAVSAPAAATSPRVELHLSVADTGIGIPKEKQSQLFIMFSQIDVSDSRRFGGSGLGLFLCDRLLQLMGGKIWVESEGERGAIFHVLLPVEVAPSPPSPPLDIRGKHVATLVRQPASRESLARELTVRGVLVHQYQSVSEIREAILQEQVQSVEMIIADIPHVEPIFAILLQQALAGRIRLVAFTTMSQWNESAGILSREPPVLPLFKPLQLSKFTSTMSNLFPHPQQETQNHVDPNNMLSPTALMSQMSAASLINPLVLLNSGSHTPSPNPSPAPDTPLKRVLIVEDNLINHKMLHKMLNGHFRTSSAYTGKQAVESASREAFDAILMDVQMPIMDGLEATRQLRANGSTVPVIACTASIDQCSCDRCISAGMNDFVPKPFNKQQLLACLKRWTQ